MQWSLNQLILHAVTDEVVNHLPMQEYKLNFIFTMQWKINNLIFQAVRDELVNPVQSQFYHAVGSQPLNPPCREMCNYY